MDVLGIGPLELVFILIIALIVLGPQEMARVGKIAGRFMRKVVLSPTWREIRNLPYRIMREAGIDEINEDLKHSGVTAPRRGNFVRSMPENKKESPPGKSEALDPSPRKMEAQESVAPEWITPVAGEAAKAVDTGSATAAPDEWTKPPENGKESPDEAENSKEPQTQKKGSEES